MEEKLKKEILREQLKTMDAAVEVLADSHKRVQLIFEKSKIKLTVEEKESCEALVARFTRILDFLFQRVFRTLDKIELQEEGTALDRLNRMEKRGIISSANLWQELRELRNEIAHEYLIEESDRVLIEAHKKSDELFLTAKKIKDYIKNKNYL